MKIAHIVRRYVKTEWGGTETVVENTVREQLALGHEARVFCTAALYAPSTSTSTSTSPSTSYYPYFYPYWPMPAADRLAMDKKGGSPYSFALFRAVREWKPDVIHIHAGGRLAAAAAKLAAELGVPSVYSLHGGAAAVPAAEMEEMLRPFRHKLPYGGVLDRLFGLRFDPLERVSAIVCISREEETRLKAKYGADRVHYLPNGVAAAKRGGEKVKSAETRILCVSRIDYQKNQLALVEAFAKLRGATLTLVGPVTAGWYGEKLRARAEELGLGDRFTLIPGLPPGSAELEAEFAKADIFVLPSVHEPFGIAALEAMTHGIPLVASAVGGLRDFIHDGENGLLFDPNAPDAADRLAAAVEKAREPSLAARLVEGGLKTAAEYGWPAIIRRLMSIYGA